MRTSHFSPLILTILLTLSLLPPAIPVAVQAQGGFNMPYGFVQEGVVMGLREPTSFALAPDGRIFVAEKGGAVRVVADGELLPDQFIDISSEVNDTGARGLLGIALHPKFPSTPYVYLAYTYDPPEIKARNPAGARVSRVLQLSADPANTNLAKAGSGVVILGTNSTAEHVGNPDEEDAAPFSCYDDAGSFVRDCLANEGTSHSLDFLQFGPDGSLYVSTGDGIVNSKGNSRALDVDSLNGKILRINPLSGDGYSSNPFFDGDPGSNRSKVFALGMRNPFRFTVDPRNGRVIVGDVGSSTWEEVNIGGAGSNFGWPCYEGAFEAATYANCDAFKSGAAAVTHAAYAYEHSITPPMLGSIIGGDLYLGLQFPAEYRGAYFYHDFNGGVVNYLTFGADGGAVDNVFGTNMPGIVQMSAGDDGSMYVLSVILGGLWRIRYAPGTNEPPKAVASADPSSGPAPLAVTFSSNGSSDPEKSLASYAWDFGDGESSTRQNPAHTYAEDGLYEAKLTITDAAGARSSDTLQIGVGSAAGEVALAEEAPAEEAPAEKAVENEDEPAAAAEEASAAQSAAGAVTAERWTEISGPTVEELTKSSQYKNDAPATETLASLELPRNKGNDYGVRVRGYLVPPTDGDYRFWIAADDRGVLFLSTDDTPDNKVVVAYTPDATAAGEYEKYPEQITGPIALKAGWRYYFEVLYKQSDGKDNLSVAWETPDAERALIQGKYLAPFEP